jgi:sialate O-acetylesterase
MFPSTSTRLSWRPAALALLSLSPLLLPASACAAVRLPAIISDHMVLQRGAAVPVWGWAAPQESVTVRIANQNRTTRAAADGRWQVELDLGAAARTPTTLAVSGADNKIVVDDVLVGEVWLASGQSNMEKPIGAKQGQKPTFDADAEIAAANHPDIRLFKVAKKKFTRPQDDVKGQWIVCTPASIEGSAFSAAAYFFGRRLKEELGTPVGLIDSTWGGTRIEPWTPVPQAAAEASAETRESGPSTIYNGMIAGLAPFGIRGVIWYQGESNIIDTEDGAAYTPKMEALVSGWRARWQADFPFYYVQVAPHLYHVVRAARVKDAQAAPRLWEAQAQALRIPKTGMIVTTDLVDDLRDIHPRDKKSVGLRLANLALSDTYGKRAIAAHGPVFRRLAVEGGKAILSFDYADGLAARDGKPLSWFEIAGADGNYRPANARIEQDRVTLSSPEVPQPATVRFAWDEAAQPNLVNRAGLPAMPFRSDHPIPAFGADGFDIAITVDDLPFHGMLPPGMTRLGIASSTLETLKAHGVPEAYGFVNAKKIADDPGSEAVLDAWRNAGYPLGNHTFSHMNLNRAASLEAWQADVIAGEPEVARRMQGADWHYLRFPNLAAGDRARSEGALAFLAARGYRVADVSVSFSDWDYTDAYARCVAKGDNAAIQAMKAHYLKGVERGIADLKAASRQVYGRVIPQVLLTHLGGWSAATLPDVMARLDAAGARYVTLAQAQADPAYQEHGGGSVVARTARKNGIRIADTAADDAPAIDLKQLCR